MWPELTVRTWIGILARRDPDWVYAAEDYSDALQEAEEARPLHELRGLIMAQVAGIEDLLRYILVESQGRIEGGGTRRRLGRIPANVALNQVLSLLDELNLAGRFDQQVAEIRSTLRRRNRLVHARVQVGFSGGRDPGLRESVIVLLLGGYDRPDESEASESRKTATDNNVSDDAEEIDELTLRRDLEGAYQALEAALDIWEAVDRELPTTDR